MLERLTAAHIAGKLNFFGELAALRARIAFEATLAPLRKTNWFVYAEPPFAEPKAVLACLSRYTHRVAIANSRLIAMDDDHAAFRVKDYRRTGKERWRPMTLTAHEFIRRFLIHVLLKGFHRIRNYGLFASAARRANINRARAVLDASLCETPVDGSALTPPRETADHHPPCPCCGGRMIVIERFRPASYARGPPGSHTARGTNL